MSADSSRDALAFVLFKYFPYGGLQRDFLRIAEACHRRGHSIRVYTLGWEGPVPDWVELSEMSVTGLTNPARYRRFARAVAEDLARRPARCRIGFNKLPGLDVYYAADPCFEARARESRGPIYRLSSRYRTFAAFERAVFAPEAHTTVLVLTDRQRADFQRWYGTPSERFHRVPPGVARDRRAGPDAPAQRRALRGELGLDDDRLLLLFLGSGFVTKGLDRALRAVAALPAGLRERVRLFVVGQDNPRRFRALADRLGVASRVAYSPGRDDVPRLLQGADLLIHPAYAETGGIVLLEAAVAGLPVIATAACGFAPYIADAGAGIVLPEPFEQRRLDEALKMALEEPGRRKAWSENGIAFGRTADIYDMPERVADLIEARLR
ncbi:MAG TPA: glycosyltransferase family 4 protein [Pseudomonadales bacterium]